MPESAGDVLMVNSLISNLKKLYKDRNIYFFTKPAFFDLIEDHPDVHKVLAYHPSFDNILTLRVEVPIKGFLISHICLCYNSKECHLYSQR